MGALTPGDVIKLPRAKTCVSRRRFTIRLVQPKGLNLVSATVLVNGKRVKVLRGTRLTARVDLRGLPKGRFKVKIVIHLNTNTPVDLPVAWFVLN